MAKRVLPIYLDKKEREILALVAERDQVSMAEVVRRSIRGLAIEVLEPKTPINESAAAR